MDAMTGNEVEPPQRKWRKATKSGVGDCVEVSPATGGIAIRDSKHPDGPELIYSPTEFGAFLDGAKKGEFDDLLSAR
jgi:hypothetical protein